MKYRCLDSDTIYEFRSFNTNYMAWIFSVKNAELFYKEFVTEKGDEVFNSIIKKHHRSINSFNDEEKNNLYQHLKYYISNVASIFKITKEKEYCEYMPASKPNFSGDIIEEMLEQDINSFFNEESHYNMKK